MQLHKLERVAAIFQCNIGQLDQTYKAMGRYFIIRFFITDGHPANYIPSNLLRKSLHEILAVTKDCVSFGRGKFQSWSLARLAARRSGGLH